MNSNNIFLITLAVLSVMVIATRLTKMSIILIVATAIIGYGITRDVIFSIALACIMGNIYVSVLYNHEIPYDYSQLEGFAYKKKKNSKSKKNKNEDVEANGDGEEYFIDKKETYLDTIKSLSPKQLKGLNDDTKNLISTQKQLLETLNQMGPALKDGKNILDTFKNYFGNEKDLKKMMPL